MARKTVTQEETKEGYVWIELFKDSGKYKDDLPVIVNGKCYLIQRGVKVQVPEIVAEVIEQSLDQQRAAVAQQEELEEEYNRQLTRF